MTRFFIAAAIASLTATGASPYELGTHARLTYEAYQRSALGSGSKLAQLGVVDLHQIFGEGYIEFDASNTNSLRRRRYDFENTYGVRSRISVTVNPVSPFTAAIYRPVGWMMAGAVREDDGAPLLGSSPIIDPTLEGGSGNRFCNHFYDPIKGASSLANAAYGDSLPCPSLDPPQSAPAWALALQSGSNIFTAQADANARRNHFTVMDAKEALWRATTGYNGAMTTKVAPFAKDRLAYWATTFRSLGDVVHVLQDMAQPQHTRNEGHPGGGRGAY
jgi:hypothetical protein